MQMLYDNVMLRELKEKSTVIRPDKAKMYPQMGEVVAVGPGDAYGYPHAYPSKDMKPMTCKKGDKVYFIRDRAYKVELETGKFYVVKERDVLGILEEKEI